MSSEFAALADVILEVCVGSVADAVAATEAGADRLELCSALELGGLTPSPGLVDEAKASVDIPIAAMNRPRAGGFHYGEREFQVMLRDADALVRAGASAVVFGILDRRGCVDVPRCRQMVQAAAGCETVFHRAFDFAPNLREALEALIDLGVTRILTSGGLQSAYDGAETIAQLVELAAGRIEILPGGGIGAAHVADLLRRTGCRQLHIGASCRVVDPSLQGNAQVGLCDLAKLEGGGYRAVDADRVVEAAAKLREAE